MLSIDNDKVARALRRRWFLFSFPDSQRETGDRKQSEPLHSGKPTTMLRRTFFMMAAIAAIASVAHADPEIVIAIRYLQAQGTSYSHLYLYREDGRLLRQLTNDNSGQDSGQIFAPDGSSIVFTREK